MKVGALDETVRELDLRSLEKFVEDRQGAITALVVKPDAHGHVTKTFELANLAQKHGLVTVITNPFHSGFVSAVMANIAACVNQDRDIPSELTSGGWFREDLLIERLQVRHGQIDVEEAYVRSQHLRMEALTQVE